jgi:hypothetical protein
MKKLHFNLGFFSPLIKCYKHTLFIASTLVFSNLLLAQPPVAHAPFLGTAATFAVFGGGAGITNSGSHTYIHGSIGTTGAATLITGFHDGVTGAVYTDAAGSNVGIVYGGIYTAPPAPGTAVTSAFAAQVMADANAAYLAISPATQPGGIDPSAAGELGGLTLAPGVYKAVDFRITTVDLVLDAQGDPNAVWIFQTSTGALTVGTPSGARSISLINGALARNVYWYVGSAATINGIVGGGTMVGTIIASAGVVISTAGVNTQTVINGRTLGLNASVTMVNTTVNAVDTWTGVTSSNWLTTTNWSTGAVPVYTEEVLIPNVFTNIPVVSIGASSLYNLTLYSGSSLNVTSTLKAGGSLTNRGGTFTASNGTIEFNGTQPQEIPALVFNTNTIKNLTINNLTGVSQKGALAITGTLTPSLGTLNTIDSLTLKSNRDATATIATGSSLGGYINGKINMQRFIPSGSRRYRFLAHPFTSAIPVTQLTDSIDITGTITGLNANHFSTTSSSAPSSFTFIEANSDGAANDAGWAAVTSANSVTTIARGQGIRVLIRGSKGQIGSLTGGIYTPDSLTLNFTGLPQQGNFTQNLDFTNASKGWNFIANPYASNIDWTSVTRNNVNNAVYTYRPSTVAYASWINNSSTNGGSNIIQSGSSFFVIASAGSASLNWHEADKTATNQPNTMFRTDAITNRFSITLKNEVTQAEDEVIVRFGDDAATNNFDAKFDALNMAASAHDLFVLDDAAIKYSIYHGAALNNWQTENRIVALGFTSSATVPHTLIVKTLNDLTNGNTAYLKDAFTGSLTELKERTSYSFDVTNDTKSQGNARFSIVFNPKEKISAAITALSIQLSPNPAKGLVKLSYSQENLLNTTITISNADGKKVKTITLGKVQYGITTINISNLSSGIYLTMAYKQETKN